MTDGVDTDTQERNVSRGAGLIMVLAGIGSLLDLSSSDRLALRAVLGGLFVLAGIRLILDPTGEGRREAEAPPAEASKAPAPAAAPSEPGVLRSGAGALGESR